MTDLNALYELENIYHKILPAQEKSSSAFVWYSGLAHPQFNAIMRITDSGLEDKVEALLANANMPLSFWVHNQNGSLELVKILQARRFQHVITCSLMIWHGGHRCTPIKALDYKITVVDLLTLYRQVAKTIYFDDEILTGLAKLFANVSSESYLLFVEDQPVATGTLIVNGKTGAIFNITTMPEYQKQGYATAMMQHLMQRANELSLDTLVLLSSPSAQKLYKKLNFTECFDIDIYMR